MSNLAVAGLFRQIASVLGDLTVDVVCSLPLGVAKTLSS